MKAIGKITLLILFFSCHENNSEQKKSITEFENKKNEFVNHIDSTSYYYTRALSDLKTGRDTEEIRKNYQSVLLKLGKESKQIYASITNMLLSGKISQNEYDQVQIETNLKIAKEKIDSLKLLGFKFYLKE